MFFKFTRKKNTISQPSADSTIFGSGVNLVDSPNVIHQIAIDDKDLQRHMMVFGTTGVGKTRLCENLIEQHIRKGYSIVYFDPKGDQQIFTKIYDIAEQCGRGDELQLVTAIYPEYSAVVDPMAYYFMPDELVSHIVSSIQAGKEPFYRNIAKEITTAVILGKLLISANEGKMPTFNIDEIRTSIRRESMVEMINTLLQIHDASLIDESQKVAGMLQDIVNSPQDYYVKVSATLRTALMELSSGNIGKIIGQADSNRFIRRLEEGKRVILVVHTGAMLTREAASTLGRVLMSMIQSFIGRVYMSKRQVITPRLSVIIDECQSVVYPGIEEIFSKGGSAGVMVTALCQSVNQLYAGIGEELGKVILDNTNSKLFMRCTDAETAEYVLKHFGTHKVLTGVFSSNQVVSREVEEDLVKTIDVLDLKARQFYLTTYSGRWKGTTADAADSKIEIEFPDAPALVTRVDTSRVLPQTP